MISSQLQLANVQTKSDTAAGENTNTMDEQNINAKEEFALVDGTESDKNVKVKSVARLVERHNLKRMLLKVVAFGKIEWIKD